MQKNIALIYGDCASPEIVTQAVRVLDKIAEKHGHTFTYTRAWMGGEAIDKFGDPLPQSELDKCLASDSVLLGAVGGPKWEGMPGDKRPEKGLLRLRAGMGLYSNNRPAKIWPQLADASPLKKEMKRNTPTPARKMTTAAMARMTGSRLPRSVSSSSYRSSRSRRLGRRETGSSAGTCRAAWAGWGRTAWGVLAPSTWVGSSSPVTRRSAEV